MTTKEEKAYQELIKLKDDYIELLGEEIDDLIGLAHVHGWKSQNVEEGIEIRKKIKKAENELFIVKLR